MYSHYVAVSCCNSYKPRWSCWKNLFVDDNWPKGVFINLNEKKLWNYFALDSSPLFNYEGIIILIDLSPLRNPPPPPWCYYLTSSACVSTAGSCCVNSTTTVVASAAISANGVQARGVAVLASVTLRALWGISQHLHLESIDGIRPLKI